MPCSGAGLGGLAPARRPGREEDGWLKEQIIRWQLGVIFAACAPPIGPRDDTGRQRSSRGCGGLLGDILGIGSLTEPRHRLCRVRRHRAERRRAGPARRQRSGSGARGAAGALRGARTFTDGDPFWRQGLSLLPSDVVRSPWGVERSGVRRVVAASVNTDLARGGCARAHHPDLARPCPTSPDRRPERWDGASPGRPVTRTKHPAWAAAEAG